MDRKKNTGRSGREGLTSCVDRGQEGKNREKQKNAVHLSLSFVDMVELVSWPAVYQASSASLELWTTSSGSWDQWWIGC